MIEIIETLRITTRPSLDVPFYKWSNSFISYTEENFVNTNKLIAYTTELSEDNLTETRKSVWASVFDFQEFVNSIEGSNEWQARETYQNANNITSTLQVTPKAINSLEEVTSISTVNLRN